MTKRNKNVWQIANSLLLSICVTELLTSCPGRSKPNIMKRIPLVVIALVIVPLTAYAQKSTYSIDNFDFRNGVKAEQPAPAPEAKPTVTAAKRRNARPAINPAAVVASQLVVPTIWTGGPSSNTGALRGYTTGSSEVDGYLIQSGTT